MFSRVKRDANGERLDEVGDDLVRAARASEGEIEAGAGGLLLYSRIRASIAARQQEPGGLAGGWLSLLQAAKFAVPAMALVMVIVTCLPRVAMHLGERRSAPKAVAGIRPAYNDTSSMARSPGPAPYILTLAAGTCALSNTQECAISNNEVLATLFADENQETQR